MNNLQTYKTYPYTFYQWIWKLVDWIYPPSCGGCGKFGVRWCLDCQQSLAKISDPICPSCGVPTSNSVCPTCGDQPLALDGLRAYAGYAGALRNAIHRLKYQRDVALGETLSYFLVELYYRVEWRVDIIVPVPLGVVRRRERGYNQAALIAYPLSLAVHVPYDAKALSRIRETSSQVDLGLSERLENVKNAFVADSARVNGRTILIVDDVTTTGATMNACAVALKKAGARYVYGFVVAKTILSKGGKNDRAS